MKVSIDEEKIKHLLNRAVEEVFVKESLEKKLRSGKQLRVKLGFDPTSPFLHIGRAIVLWKLREFQDLGHKVVFIVGDFTALVGDPSDKLEKRPMLTAKKVKDNLKNYRAQIGKILDLRKAEFHLNSKWLKKLDFNDVAELAECFSLQQMSHRRNFADRIEKGEEISLREFLYPLMQGYDSVAVKADVEIGGTDQRFNLLAGRELQRYYKQEPQDIITNPLVEGLDGRKMSSSWGNTIDLLDEPQNMFGKIMSLNDSLIVKYFIHCTRVPMAEVEAIQQALKGNTINPRDAKLKLAEKITALYHGEKKALQARNDFINTFAKRGAPADLKEEVVEGGKELCDIILSLGLVASKTEWRRLVLGRAVENMENGETIQDYNFKLERGGIFKIGKKRFVKIAVR